jgi:HJR/Mrr/RecB family endonuclease
LLKSYDQTPDKDPQDPRNMLHLFDEFRGNPRAIGMAFNMLKYDSAESLLATINNPLDYKNEFIRDYLSKQQIVLPSAPKIIQDVRFINSRIVDRINRDPSSMYDLSPRDFEILVKELFEERGHKVELTGQTRDGGKDLIIVNTSELGNLLIYGECKRYSPDHPVGVSVVSDLVGRVMTDRATAGIVITSSYFSPDAKVLSEKIPHQMSLIDYKKLSDWLTKVE